MKCGKLSQGFTIVETLIFLAVTSALLISSLTLLQGQQGKAEFQQSINDAQQQINKIINNVANGYYPKKTDFSCTVSGGGNITVDPSGHSELGSNDACEFIGRVIKFNTSSGFESELRVYTVVGARLNTSGGDTKNMSDANPQLIMSAPGTPAYETIKLKYGLKVVDVCFDTCQPANKAGSIGFFTDFGQVGATGNSTSSSQQSDFIPISNQSLNNYNSIMNINSNAWVNNYKPAPGGDLNKQTFICLNSGSTDQSVKITIGGNNKIASTELKVNDKTYPTDVTCGP